MNAPSNFGSGGNENIPRFLESKPLSSKNADAQKTKKQAVVLGVLVLVLVLLMIQTFAGKKKPAPAAQAPAAPVQTAAPQPPVEVTPENDIFQAEGFETDRSSPFSRGPAGLDTGAGPAPLVLQGILTDRSGAAYAVINEKIVKKGGRVADNTVETIQPDSVTLRSDSGEEWTLRMNLSRS